MEKMLLYWSVDQYNNVQKFVERKGGAIGAMLPDGRKELILCHNKQNFKSSHYCIFLRYNHGQGSCSNKIQATINTHTHKQTVDFFNVMGSGGLYSPIYITTHSPY